MIYSYKHNIGPEKRCVERYQGREQSFMTERTYELLKKVSEQVLIVPTTTRTREQYERIDFGVAGFPYVLVCNGGVLLVDGKEDESWYRESLAFAAKSQKEMEKAKVLMDRDSNRILELRYIKELFLFTKSGKPERSAALLKKELDLSLVDVFCNGGKVYVVPRELNKGAGVHRLRKKLNAEIVIAAGDSGFDIPMLEYADYSIAPMELIYSPKKKGIPTFVSKEAVFSEKVLERVLEIVR